MNATVYNILTFVFFGIGLVLLIIAVILFFKFKVVSLAEELSGKRARKQVEEIRKENASAKSNGYVPNLFARNSNSVHDTGRLRRESEELKAKTGRMKTEKIGAEIQEDTGGTVLLTNESIPEDTGGTTLLNSGSNDEGTTLLVNDYEGTTLLGSGELRNFDSTVTIEVIEEVLVTDSGEILRV